MFVVSIIWYFLTGERQMKCIAIFTLIKFKNKTYFMLEQLTSFLLLLWWSHSCSVDFLSNKVPDWLSDLQERIEIDMIIVLQQQAINCAHLTVSIALISNTIKHFYMSNFSQKILSVMYNTIRENIIHDVTISFESHLSEIRRVIYINA